MQLTRTRISSVEGSETGPTECYALDYLSIFCTVCHNYLSRVLLLTYVAMHRTTTANVSLGTSIMRALTRAPRVGICPNQSHLMKESDFLEHQAA